MVTHLLAVNVEKAKKRINKLQNQIDELESFIDCAENYQEKTFEQRVIKRFAELGSIFKVTEAFNNEIQKQGQGRIYKLSDIKEVIDSKPIDELHKHVRKIYKTNKKNTNV